jgi:hypothetical protein
MLARLLALQGGNVELVFVDGSERRSDWNVLDEVHQEAFVREQLELARYLLPLNANVQLWSPDPNLMDPLEADRCFTLFVDRVRAQEAIYQLAPYFLHLLSDGHCPALPEGFLLGRDTLGALPSSVQAIAPYLVWHVRKGQWAKDRDSEEVAIQSDFAELRGLFPHHNVMVLSSPSGIDHALDVLSRSGLLDNGDVSATRVFGQPENGFINAIPWVLGADFYFQRLGGGVGQIAIFSTVPYIYVSNDSRAAASFGLVGQCLVSWARKDQVFALHPDSAPTIRLADIVDWDHFRVS